MKETNLGPCLQSVSHMPSPSAQPRAGSAPFPASSSWARDRPLSAEVETVVSSSFVLNFKGRVSIAKHSSS